jgi:hypothetical protein
MGSDILLLLLLLLLLLYYYYYTTIYYYHEWDKRLYSERLKRRRKIYLLIG